MGSHNAFNSFITNHAVSIARDNQLVYTTSNWSNNEVYDALEAEVGDTTVYNAVCYAVGVYPMNNIVNNAVWVKVGGTDQKDIKLKE